MGSNTHTRSKAFRCLFCYKSCDKTISLIEGDIVGAVRCVTLQRHLQQYFILRQLLEIPVSWCEDNLKKCNPESWFRLCDACVKVVAEAWHVHQKLLQLQMQMKGIKETILRAIKRSSKLKSRSISMEIEDDIRKILVPDLNRSVLKHFDDRETDTLVLDSPPSNYDTEFLSEDYEDFNEFAGTVSDQGDNRSQKKSRAKKKQKIRRNPRKASFHWQICSKCPARYSSVEEYESHLEAHEESLRTGGMYDCKLCSYPARSSGELDLHVNDKHENKKERNKEYSCTICDFKTSTWKVLREHVQTKHPGVKTDDAPDLELKCPSCMKTFETRSTLVVHQKKMHPEMFGAEQESLECKHCSMLFPDKIRLKYHVNSEHYRINRYVCDTCGKGFRFINGFERHKISHQKGERNFVCHVCGCDYAYDSILQEHYRKFHPQVVEGNKDGVSSKIEGNDEYGGTAVPGQEFSCKYCNLKTPFKTVLLRHMQTHKADMGFQCDICNKCYTSAQGLKRHKSINHPASDAKVNCPYCQKLFPHVDYMKTHIRLYCKMKQLQERANDSCSEPKRLKAAEFLMTAPTDVKAAHLESDSSGIGAVQDLADQGSVAELVVPSTSVVSSSHVSESQPVPMNFHHHQNIEGAMSVITYKVDMETGRDVEYDV